MGNVFTDMAVGETRTWVRLNGEAFTITRTDRAFIHDWVDASNRSLIERGQSGFRWIVTPAGDTALVPASKTGETR
jgi:hypothetical protein